MLSRTAAVTRSLVTRRPDARLGCRAPRRASRGSRGRSGRRRRRTLFTRCCSIAFFSSASRQESRGLRRTGPDMAPTQGALYDGIDLELSWSERALPQRERTKHVHACTRTSASSSRSSWRSCSRATSGRGSACSIPSRARDDARPGARERPRRDGRGPRRLQRPADARQDRALRAGGAHGARGDAVVLRPCLVRTAGRRRAARLSRVGRGLRARGRPAGVVLTRAARSARRARHFASTSRARPSASPTATRTSCSGCPSWPSSSSAAPRVGRRRRRSGRTSTAWSPPSRTRASHCARGRPCSSS
jgi:hypothetical protein